jgi:hypothetical protein
MAQGAGGMMESQLERKSEGCCDFNAVCPFSMNPKLWGKRVPWAAHPNNMTHMEACESVGQCRHIVCQLLSLNANSAHFLGCAEGKKNRNDLLNYRVWGLTISPGWLRHKMLIALVQYVIRRLLNSLCPLE